MHHTLLSSLCSWHRKHSLHLLSLPQVLYYGLPAAAAAVLINSKLASLITQYTSAAAEGPSSIPTAAAAAADGLSDPVFQQAVLHFTQEAVLFAAMPTACYIALGKRVVSTKWDPYWVVQTLATCVVLFPLVDPMLSNLWRPAVTVSAAV